MDDLIEALTILKKYVADDDCAMKYPTNCQHDVLYVNVDPKRVSEEDVARLKELGFANSDDCDGFQSFRFGSC